MRSPKLPPCAMAAPWGTKWLATASLRRFAAGSVTHAPLPGSPQKFTQRGLPTVMEQKAGYESEDLGSKRPEVQLCSR